MQTEALVLVILAGSVAVYWIKAKKGPAVPDHIDMSFSEVETAILVHLFRHGDDVPANIGERQGVHRNSVVRSAGGLVDDELIRNKGNGVYTLTDDGLKVARRLSELDDLEDDGEDGGD